MENWIINSGATYHMYPNRNWFSTYSLITSGVILIGNDSLCKAIGIGTVKIQMHNEIVRTLLDVRHVPNMAKNLISLGTLKIIGCKFTRENEIMKISRDTLTVIKARRSRSLYVLQGKIVIGIAAISTSSM